MKRLKSGQIMLNNAEHGALIEALRRRCRFNDRNQSITEQWTGLGSAREYKAAVDAGFMACATGPNPGHMTWWKLTETGARIVIYWMGQGFDAAKIENSGDLPSANLPVLIF